MDVSLENIGRQIPLVIEKRWNTYVRDPEEMCVKLVHVHQPPDLEGERNNSPYVERGEEKEEEESKPREPKEESAGSLGSVVSPFSLGDTSVDNNVGQPGDMLRSYARVLDASQEEGGKPDDESYCATQNA